ncbi:O-antigen/teichoic acid export membrane protein [Sphingobium jiangsuense]|uniref:O-antigen/teichoic acid export membrane protein n=1 Tax=Sphingobium jiangsuense TaxID=870476 RepID=A0A7W6FRS6_9SPHN|nr:lipopolysaccharide biosynthesis protein [Sphingobium jiangsuense]MBB3927972.1 O-antigen/teichoic acid export membrane protein [Sphingobium jiangsuense]
MDHMQDANVEDRNFGSRVRNAVFWRSGSQIVAQAVSWASTLIVVRLLDPSDYGLFAMTQVVLNFMSFMNGVGLVSALVQAPTLDNRQLRQAFGLMLVLNGGLALAQLALAGVAADYYNQPLVATMLRVQALIYLATPFISLPEVLIGRSLSFKRPALVNIITALVTATVSLVGALLGWGVWTLVVAPIIGFWVKGVGNMIATRFFMLPSFDFRGSGGILLFGASLLGSQLLIMVQSQADILIGGRVLDPHELGLYAEALFLTQIFVSRFIPPLNDVAFPVYSRMQANKPMLSRAFCRAAGMILLAACPLYLGMAVVALPMVELLFGRKWLEMAPFVSILAASMPFYALQVLFAPALNAVGRPHLTAWISGVGAILMPTTFLIGVGYGGLGLAVAWATGIPLLTLATIRIAGPVLGLHAADLVRAITPALGASIPMALIVLVLYWMLPPLPAVVQLGVLVSAGVVSYGGILYLFWRDMLKELIAMLRNRTIEMPAEG